MGVLSEKTRRSFPQIHLLNSLANTLHLIGLSWVLWPALSQSRTGRMKGRWLKPISSHLWSWVWQFPRGQCGGRGGRRWAGSWGGSKELWQTPCHLRWVISSNQWGALSAAPVPSSMFYLVSQAAKKLGIPSTQAAKKLGIPSTPPPWFMTPSICPGCTPLQLEFSSSMTC